MFGGHQAAAIAAIELGPADPLADRLGADAQLAGHVGNRAVAITAFGGRLGHQPDRSLYVSTVQSAGLGRLCVARVGAT